MAFLKEQPVHYHVGVSDRWWWTCVYTLLRAIVVAAAAAAARFATCQLFKDGVNFKQRRHGLVPSKPKHVPSEPKRFKRLGVRVRSTRARAHIAGACISTVQS